MAKINEKIFKAYDIRGIYPEELDEKSAEIIGRTTTKFLKGKAGKENIEIVVGRDTRSSSPSLFKSLVKGIKKEGGKVIDVGLSPTPVFYFGVWNSGFDGGIMITASHNPPKYNGFKIVERGAQIIGENTGIDEIKRIALSLGKKEEKEGIVEKIDVLPDYLNLNLKGINLKELEDLKVVIDTGNAVPGVLIEKLKERVPFEIIHLFPELVPGFPNHAPNPLEEKNIKDLKKKVLEEEANLGVAFDGDGDRIIFVDEKGEEIFPDFITCLMAKILLRENKGETMVYTIISTNGVKDAIEENGGKAIPWKVGHTFIKEKMRKEGAIFAGEYSGHYLLKSQGFCESPLFVLLNVLSEIKRTGKRLSELISPYKRYFYSGVVNFEVDDKEKKLKELEEKYKEGKITKIDGLRVDFDDFWFLARASNTENLLRVAVEAKNRALMEEKLKEIEDIAIS